MIFLKAMLLVLGWWTISGAASQPTLHGFMEKNGCKLLVAEEVVKRLQEIASQGSVAWDGECKNGVISGRGVLRQEGTAVTAGRTKKFAYYLTGKASNGMRSGRWTRETFDMFIDSPRFYTSAATVDFADGVSPKPPRPFPVTRPDQLSPAFRQFVAQAGLGAESANKALQILVAAAAAAPQTAPNTKVGPTVRSLALPPEASKAVILEDLQNCWIDQINAKAVGSEPAAVTAGENMQVTGWAVDIRSATVPRDTWIVLVSTKTRKIYRSAVARLNAERPDVARTLGSSKFLKPGFEANIPTAELGAGEYQLSIAQEVGSEIQICHHKPTIVIQNKP